MSLKAQLTEDMKSAMKAKDKLALTTIRGLISEIKKDEIDKKTELSDDQVITVVQREVKKRRDAIEFAEKAERQEAIDDANAEIKVLQNYLGEQLSEEELTKIIDDLIAEGTDNIGKIMGALNGKYKGQFEGKVASQIVKAKLG